MVDGVISDNGQHVPSHVDLVPRHGSVDVTNQHQCTVATNAKDPLQSQSLVKSNLVQVRLWPEKGTSIAIFILWL